MIVNNIPITTYDIQRRAAFLKLQRSSGNLSALAETTWSTRRCRIGEAQRLDIRSPTSRSTPPTATSPQSNKMPVKQLDGIMNQTGVTKAHFKEFIRAQMAGTRRCSARYRADGGHDRAGRGAKDAEAGRRQANRDRIHAAAGDLRRAGRASAARSRKRKREADAMRARFTGCDSTREFAKGLIDVTVRDLGRELAPELPGDWAEQIKSTKIGGATPVRETDRGVEFIGICSAARFPTTAWPR